MFDLSLSIDQLHSAATMMMWIAIGITAAFGIDLWFCRRGRRRQRAMTRR